MGGGWLGFGVCRGGRWDQRCPGGAARDEVDVLSGGGTGEEDALERHASQDAPVQMGADGGEVGCAEVGGDGAEVGGCGALADGADQVAAVGEEAGDDVEEARDVGGRSGGGVILWRIGRRGDWRRSIS